MVTHATRFDAQSPKFPRFGFLEGLCTVLFSYAAVFFFLAGMFSGRALVLAATLERRCKLASAELKLDQIVSGSDRVVHSGLGDNGVAGFSRNEFFRGIVSEWQSIPKGVRQVYFEDYSKTADRIRAIESRNACRIHEDE